MPEVKSDLLYKDHISSSPATSQGDITYALLWMFFILFFYTGLQSALQGVDVFVLHSYNRKQK